MIVQHRRVRPPLFRNLFLTLAIAVPLVPLGIGCEQPSEGGLEISEGASIEGTNGLRTGNGLTTTNGRKTGNGLSLSSALSQGALSSTSGLMTTADGRLTVSYMVKCALPEGRTLVKSGPDGVKYSFPGKVGLAPEWENGSCGQTCQEWVSACLLSLVNATGQHVPVYMMAEHPAVGFGKNWAYPRQEGAFFGNLFATTPVAYYCKGRDYSFPILGRIGSAQVDSTYSNIYGSGTCSRHCTGSDYPYTGDGFKACSGWNRVVTIWHQ